MPDFGPLLSVTQLGLLASVAPPCQEEAGHHSSQQQEAACTQQQQNAQNESFIHSFIHVTSQWLGHPSG
jgi:hypothetical protein